MKAKENYISICSRRQLVHLLNPGMYERIIIIQVTTRIIDSPLLIPTALPSIVVNFISVKIEQFIHLFHDRTWNGTMFTNHNQRINATEKITKKSQEFNSILGRMKKILYNFQWNPPSKMRKRDDRTLKTFSCEISFWALRHVSVAIVTIWKKFKLKEILIG